MLHAAMLMRGPARSRRPAQINRRRHHKSTTSMRVNCVDTSTTILFRNDISISILLLGESKVIKQNYKYYYDSSSTREQHPDLLGPRDTMPH